MHIKRDYNRSFFSTPRKPRRSPTRLLFVLGLAVGLLLLVFAISGLGQQVHKIGFIIMLGLVLFGTLAQQIIIMLVLAFSGFTMQWGFNLTFVIAPTILYNLVLIWPVYWFVLRLQRRVSRTGSSV